MVQVCPMHVSRLQQTLWSFINQFLISNQLFWLFHRKKFKQSYHYHFYALYENKFGVKNYYFFRIKGMYMPCNVFDRFDLTNNKFLTGKHYFKFCRFFIKNAEKKSIMVKNKRKTKKLFMKTKRKCFFQKVDVNPS